MNTPLPSDTESEANALACALIDPKDRADVLARLTSDDFMEPRHSRMVSLMAELAKEGRLTGHNDLVVIRDVLKDRGELEAFGGSPGLMDLADIGRIETYRVGEHIDRITEFSARRRILRQAQCVIAGVKQGKSSDELIAEWQRFAIGEHVRGDDRSTRDVADVLNEVVETLESRAASGQQVGLSTGFARLDGVTHGWRPGGRYLVGARPGKGKSTLMTRFAFNAATQGVRVLFFSVEVEARLFTEILWAQEAAVNSEHLQEPAWLTEGDWAELTQAVAQIPRGRLLVNDDGRLTLEKLVARTLAAKADGGLDFVIVDYLQRMKAPRGHSRQAEIAELSAGICALAQQLNIPFLCACQLNREIERRDDQRPRLSDLRESGDLEQDFDVVMLMSEQGEPTPESVAGTGVRSILLEVAKNRFGRRGLVDFTFKPWVRQFEEAYG